MTEGKAKDKKRGFDRRTFMGAVAVVGAGAVLAGCKKTYPPVSFIDKAPDGPLLKAGLIGCGERGTGAALNFLKAGPNLRIVALADVLKDHQDKCREMLAEKAQVEIPDDHCFLALTPTNEFWNPMSIWCCWPRRHTSAPYTSMPRLRPKNTASLRSLWLWMRPA